MQKKPESSCDSCMNYYYDQEFDCYACALDMDEDEAIRLMTDSRYQCPYYRPGDEYTIVRKQI